MPRHRRAAPAGCVQHVLNRGNERAAIFHKPADYEAFLAIIADGLERFAVKLLAFCLMRNHFHLVLVPLTEYALSEYMRWTMNVHVRRYRRHAHSVGNGHIYQDRYKNFVIEEGDDVHLLTVLRYVEGNAARAGLVKQAEDWPWSSLSRTKTWDARTLVSPWPVARPENWVEMVNGPFSIETLQRIRESANRGAPFGTPEWTQVTAKQLGIESTVRPPRRPAKPKLGAGGPKEESVTVPLLRPLFE
jgi:REP-associated tyrosine transposase